LAVNRKIQAIRLRRLQGKLGDLAGEFTKVHFASFRRPESVWQPAVNLFQCYHCFRVCADLAGVDPKNVELTVEPGRLWIRGHRSPPEPGPSEQSEVTFPIKAVRVLAMEIDYGQFERAISLPEDADISRVTTEWENGLLWIGITRLNQA
jgi:HSP20 family protein